MATSKSKTKAEAAISLLGYTLLSLLARKERTGYELSRFTSGVRSMIFASSGHSNIYKELAKLKKRKYVTFRVVKETRPFDKKVYTLTPLGLETLRVWLRSDPELFVTRRELNIRVHALWLLNLKEARAFLDKQIGIIETEIESLKEHSSYLQKSNKIGLPPPPQHPLFGTYFDIMLEIEKRELTINWCKWMKRQWNTGKTARTSRNGRAPLLSIPQ